MRLEPPSGSPISPGAENSAGGGTAAILGREASVPPATCLLLLGPQPSQHCSCARAEGQQNPGELGTRPVPWARRAVEAGRGNAPNILPLQMQQEPVDMAWDAAAHCSSTIANTGTGDQSSFWRGGLEGAPG